MHVHMRLTCAKFPSDFPANVFIYVPYPCVLYIALHLSFMFLSSQVYYLKTRYEASFLSNTVPLPPLPTLGSVIRLGQIISWSCVLIHRWPRSDRVSFRRGRGVEYRLAVSIPHSSISCSDTHAASRRNLTSKCV